METTCDWNVTGHLLELRVMMKYNESKVIIYQGNGHKRWNGRLMVAEQYGRC